MKIDFAELQPSLDSLQAKTCEKVNGFIGVVTGSQILLRARLKQFPGEAALILELLKEKDLDPHFEPADTMVYDIKVLREVAEKLFVNLTRIERKKNQGITQSKNQIPDPWTSYYTLPVSEIKDSKKNQIDCSIQAKATKPCMNIDQKSDFHGEIIYVNDKYKQDFEVTYLQENLILFYDLETFDTSTYQDQNKLAFMLRKCIKREVTQFGTLLTEETALFIKNLFENPQKSSDKQAIFAEMKRHYNLDPEATELELRELYENSLNKHKSKHLKVIAEQYTVVSSMLHEIKKSGEDVTALDKELGGIMSSSSSPTIHHLKKQVDNLLSFKAKIMPQFEVANNKILQEELLTLAKDNNDKADSTKTSDQTESTEATSSKSNQKKKKKAKKSENESEKQPTDADVKTIVTELEKIKKDNPQTPESKLKSLIENDINNFKTQFPKSFLKKLAGASESGRQDIFYTFFVKVLELSIKDNGAKNSCLAIFDFYKDFFKTHKSDGVKKLNEITPASSKKDIFILIIHEYMEKIFIRPQMNIEAGIFKIMQLFHKQQMSSEDQNCMIYIGNLTNLLITSGLCSVNKVFVQCIDIVIELSSIHIRELLEGATESRNEETLRTIALSLEIQHKAASISAYKNSDDVIDSKFVNQFIVGFLVIPRQKTSLINYIETVFIANSITDVILCTPSMILRDKLNEHYRTAISTVLTSCFNNFNIFTKDKNCKQLTFDLVPDLINNNLITLINYAIPRLGAPNECCVEMNSTAETYSDELKKIDANAVLLLINKIEKGITTKFSSDRGSRPVLEQRSYDLALRALAIFKLMINDFHKEDFYKHYYDNLHQDVKLKQLVIDTLKATGISPTTKPYQPSKSTSSQASSSKALPAPSPNPK